MKLDFRSRILSALTFSFMAAFCLTNGNFLNAMVVQEDEKVAEEVDQEKDNKANQEEEKSLGDHLRDLQEKIQKEQREFYKKLDEFGEDEQEAMMEFANKNAPDFSDEWGKLMEMVKANPDDKAAPRALGLIGQFDFDGELGAKASQMLISDYIDSPQAMEALSSLAYEPSAANEAKFKAILANNDNPKTLAAVRFTYAEFLMGAEDFKAYLSDEEAREYMGEETIEYLTAEREKSFVEQAEALLNMIIEDEKAGKQVVNKAKRRLFALQNLGIGKVAPDIVGKDTDGVEFKLSDYRGKVVMLDFWGDW